MIETYAEYGAVGVIVSLFVMMIVNLMKSQRAQNEDLDNIRQAIAKMESTIENVEGIVIKLIERWNRYPYYSLKFLLNPLGLHIQVKIIML